MISPLSSLNPCFGIHSIKEATVSFFLASKIVKPEEYLTLLSGALKDRYQQFSPANQVQMKIGPIVNTELKVTNNTGFRMVGFDAGKIANVILGQNELNRSFFSFHSLQYKDWTTFIENVISDAKIIGKQESKFIIAYSLQYIDEFIWRDNQYKANLFFKESKYLPDDIFDSNILEYSLSLDKKYREKTYLDRITINVNDQINHNKLISIIHNLTFLLNEKELLEFNKLLDLEDFRTNMNFAHDANKSTLRAILSNDVCNLINLK